MLCYLITNILKNLASIYFEKLGIEKPQDGIELFKVTQDSFYSLRTGFLTPCNHEEFKKW